LGDALVAGYDQARLEEYLGVVALEAIDGRRARCWDSIHRIVNSKPWECDEVTLPWKLLWRTSWWQSISREVSRKLKQIQGSTRNRENEGMTGNPRCMLYSVYAVLGVCCTRCML